MTKASLLATATVLATLTTFVVPSTTSLLRRGIHCELTPDNDEDGGWGEGVPIDPPSFMDLSLSELENRPSDMNLYDAAHSSDLDQNVYYEQRRASTSSALPPTLTYPFPPLDKELVSPTNRAFTTYQFKTNGTFQNFVLLVRFADHVDRELPSRDDILRLYNSMDTPIFNTKDGIVPTGSVKQFYESVSYSTLSINTVVSEWITISKPEEYYGNGANVSKFKEAIVEALGKLDSTNGFDFSDLEHNEDGSIDGFGVLHSGYDAAVAGNDCHTGAIPQERIWSHKGGLSEPWTPSSGYGVTMQRYYASSSLRGTCNSNIVRMGVIVHEIGHFLGLPDLYDETFTGAGLGAYDFMSEAWGWDGSGIVPPSLSAWSKVQLGWAEVATIVYDGTYLLESSTTSNTVFKIEAGYPEGEYLLIENRQKTGYDSLMRGDGGIAIYHIDEKANGQNERGYPSMPRSKWPQNARHYMVALLPADGGYDMEKQNNRGDAFDLWHSGSVRKELRSGPGAPHPNTDSYQYGNVIPTGLRMFGFSNSGKLMSFKVEGLEMSEASKAGFPGIAVSLESMPKPTMKPTAAPIASPPTLKLTAAPITTPPTMKPTASPTASPPTMKPTASPITSSPTPPALSKLPPNTNLEASVATVSYSTNLNQMLTSKPSIPKFTPATPTSTPPTSKPGTRIPSRKPLAQPPMNENDAIASPASGYALASSTATEQKVCSKGKNLCIKEILQSNCPMNVPERTCAQVDIGELCVGICGSSPSKNCPPFDVYIRIDCNAIDNPAAAKTVNNSCPYYPGWAASPPMTQAVCLNDCRPVYISSSPNFEFDSIEGCCSNHYKGITSCLAKSP